MYLSPRAVSFDIKIAVGIAINAIIKLIKNNFPVFLKLSTVKLDIKVPITNAGIKRIFSSLDKTVDELSGTKLNLRSINPIIIKIKRTAI